MNIQLGQAYGFYQIGQRKNQEDARFPDTDIPPEGQRFFIVCDGVGGLDKGEVASSTVAEAIGEYLEQYDLNKPFSMKELGYALGAGYAALDKKNVGANRGMATTLTLLVAHAGGITVAHIGDSRIYQIRPGQDRGGVIYRSYDHSLVNALVRCGTLTPDQAINHPKSNIITRCMGGEDPESRSEATSYCLTDIEPGDVFILCSDGVLHDLTDQDLVNLINADSTLEQKAMELAQRSASSSDNNTAFLIPVETVNGLNMEQFMARLISQTPPPVEEEEDAASEVPITTPISPDTTHSEEIQAEQEPPSLGNKVSSWFKKLF